MYFEMAKLNSKKWKKSLFYEEKSLVGLTPEVNSSFGACLKLFVLKWPQTIVHSGLNIIIHKGLFN
jgi:hypothetical protein